LSTAARPFGVNILVLLDIVLGVLILLSESIMQIHPFPAFGVFNILAAIAFALIDFILAYALWSRRKWAWISSLIF
jgi:hypothetical protein